AMSAYAFDERALWNEFDLHPPFDHQLLGLGIEPDVAGNRLADEALADKLADTSARLGRIVRNHYEIALALAHEFLDQSLGCARPHEAPNHEACPIGNQRYSFCERRCLHGPRSARISSPASKSGLRPPAWSSKRRGRIQPQFVWS